MTGATRLPGRSVIRIAGDDPQGFLQGLVTSDVARLAQGPIWTGLLTPQGKALFDFMLWPDGDAVLADVERDQAEAFVRRLSLYRLRRAVTITPNDLAVHWSPDAEVGQPDPRLAALGNRWLGTATKGEATGWEAHRLALGVTEGVADLGSGETLWLECNARELGGVDFTKGCYIGQENTARMHHRSKVNRRLVVAPIGEAGDRTRAQYPELGLMVEHRRVDALGDAIIPAWLAAALDDQPASWAADYRPTAV